MVCHVSGTVTIQIAGLWQYLKSHCGSLISDKLQADLKSEQLLHLADTLESVVS